MQEPILTFLMPAYAIVSWYALYLHGGTGKHLLPLSLFGWVWAVFNIVRTRRLDLGVVTFAFVIISTLWERHSGFYKGVKLALSISCILLAANFSLVVIFWNSIVKELARSKTQLWLSVFWWYCTIMTVFWLFAAVRNQIRGVGETYMTSVMYGSLQQ